MSTWSRGETTVRWLRGGLWVRHGSEGLLVDAPPGVTAALGDELPQVDSVLLTSGRLGSVGGLVELLVALEPHRLTSVPLSVRSVLGEERGPTLAEAWVRGWPDRYPVTLDALMGGSIFDVGALQAETVPVRSGEPVWRTGEVIARVAAAVRITTPSAIIAWVPGAAPGRVVGHAVAGADLAVVEVGVRPWPRTEERWRLSLSEALDVGLDVAELWVVGDDGNFVGDDA